MTYLFIAYAAFWGITFALVFSIFFRQKAIERDLSALELSIDREKGQKSEHRQG